MVVRCPKGGKTPYFMLYLQHCTYADAAPKLDGQRAQHQKHTLSTKFAPYTVANHHGDARDIHKAGMAAIREVKVEVNVGG